MPRAKKKAVATKPLTEPEKFRCRCCLKSLTLGSSNFYQATNHMIDKSGYLSVCKTCCSELFNEYFKSVKMLNGEYACFGSNGWQLKSSEKIFRTIFRTHI